MAISVGSVEVDVVPNTRGIYAQLRSGIMPAAQRVGDEAGRAAGDRFGPAMQGAVGRIGLSIGEQIGEQIAARITATVRDALRDGVTQGGVRARGPATRQGEQTGGAFARSLRAKLEQAFRSMPRLDVRLSDTGVDADLARLRARMETLASKRIGIDVDTAAALAEVNDIEARLAALGAAHPDVNVRADTAAARAALVAIREEVDALTRDPARIRVESDGTFATRLKAEVQAAQAALPNINLDADATPAQMEIARIRSSLGQLADVRVGVDLDAAAALARIQQLSARLQALQAQDADVQVRVDTAAAMAQLATVTAMVDSLDSRRAEIKISHRQAMRAILQLTAAIGGLAAIPAVPVLAAGIGSIAAAATAAGAGVGAIALAAVPAVMDISKALQAQKAAQDAATTATAKGGAAAVQAQQRAIQQASAAQALAAAERNGARQIAQAQAQVIQARRGVADATAQAALRSQQAARQVQDAERSLADAQRDARRAQEELTDARKTAAQQLQDLNDRLAGAALDERAAILRVQEAQQQLAKTRTDPRATELQRAQAQLSYDQAVQGLKEQRKENGRLKSEAAEANRAGVEGSEAVRAAHERVADAQQQVADRARAVRDAEANATRVQLDNARAIADAQAKVVDAQKGVAAAQQQAADSVASAQRQMATASLAAAGGVDQAAVAQAKYQAELAKLTPAARGTFNAFTSLRSAFTAWSRSLQPAIMPIFTRALNGMKNSLPGLTPFVLAAARAIGTLQDRVSRGFKSPWWLQFKKDLAGSVEPALVGLGVSFGRIFKGMAGIVQAFLPHMDRISAKMQSVTGRFANWGSGLKGSPEFERFLSYSAEQGPILARAMGDVGSAFLEVGKALSPLSGPALKILGALASGIASIAESLPWLIQGMYLALIATRLWTIGLVLFNAVMSANPITLIIIAIVALVAAVIYAWKNFGWFRTAVMAAWNGIKTAALWAWNTVLKPVFNALAAIVMWLWNYIIKPYFNFVMAYWRMVASVAMWLWRTILDPVFRAIGALIALWWAGVKKYFNFVMFIVRNAAKVIFWFWKNVIMIAVRAIVQLFKWWWAGVKLYFNFVRAIIRTVANAFKWLYDKGIKPPLNWIADRAKWVWNKAIKPAFDKIKSGVRLVGEAFDKGQKAIGKAWNKIKDATKKPIRWVIDTVYNNGVVKLWNTAAKVLPLDKLTKINLKGYARGGILPGYQTRQRDDVLTPMRRGEGVLVPEAVRGIGPKLVHGLNHLANKGGVSAVRNAVGYAKGGIVGDHGGIGDWFGGKIRQLGGILGKAKDWVLGGVTAAAKAAAKPVRDLINRIPGADGGFGKFVKAVPRGILDGVLSAIKGSEDEQTAGGQWVKPVDAKYGTRFGVAGRMWSSGRHTGLDFPAPTGKAVKAVAAGTVTGARSGGPYGKHIAISHGGGLSSLYAHLSNMIKTAGAVKPGQRIGSVGATGNVTGPHLHLEARQGGKPIDPMPFLTGGGSGGGRGVQRWRGLVLSVLRELGQPASLANTVLRRMSQESGGNPRAINNWDINAKRGDPSKGLMQVIGSTFRAYAGKYRSRGVWDPRANIYASMRYALSRYGSLSRAYNRPGGYDSGGWLMPGQLGYNGLRQPEAVLTPGQWRSISSLAAQGGGGGLQPGDSLRLVVGDQEFHAYVDGRADGRVAAGNQRLLSTVRAGRKIGG